MNSQLQLLDDVMVGSDELGGFHDLLLCETLRLAGRQRMKRRALRAVSTLAVVALIASTALRRPVTPATSTVPAEKYNYALVKTKNAVAFSSLARISTAPLEAKQRISSYAATSTIRTRHLPDAFKFVNDFELLALASPKPVLLFRVAPKSQQLVFLEPDDQNSILR